MSLDFVTLRATREAYAVLAKATQEERQASCPHDQCIDVSTFAEPAEICVACGTIRET